MDFRSLFLILLIHQAVCLIPPKFQWKTVDFAWETPEDREVALKEKNYIPENCMPAGLVRWKDKLFITIPRWKRGVPSSLNYIYMNGSQQNQLLNPYPTWKESFAAHKHCCVAYNSTVVSASRMFVDTADRLWVVDNGVSDMANEAKRITRPAILTFDLNSDALMQKYELGEDVVRDSSVFSSIVVDITPGKGKKTTNTFAYITDLGSNAIIVFSLNEKTAWRVENHCFSFDRTAGEYKIGGIQFNSSDGISGAALAQTKKDGHRDLYFSPTSSTKQFRVSTRLLKNRTVSMEDLFNSVELNKNGVGCWNIDKPFNDENNPVVMSDCNMLEFPNDIKVDREGNIWMLSNGQARFLNESMNFTQVNFRVLMTPVTNFVQGTSCAKLSKMRKVFKCIKPKSAKEKPKK